MFFSLSPIWILSFMNVAAAQSVWCLAAIYYYSTIILQHNGRTGVVLCQGFNDKLNNSHCSCSFSELFCSDFYSALDGGVISSILQLAS